MYIYLHAFFVHIFRRYTSSHYFKAKIRLHLQKLFQYTSMFLHLTLFSAMFDSIPLLSLADEAETEVTSRSSERHVATHASDNNAAHAQKLERLEKEMTAMGRRLEQETLARRKLQEILLQAGLSLPGDAAFPD